MPPAFPHAPPNALALYTASQVRAIEQAAVAQGDDLFALMQRAGRAAAALAQRRWPAAQRVAVACGSGNNGGDGYVAAAALREAGVSVFVVATGPARRPEGAAAEREWRERGGEVLAADAQLPAVDLWLDAVLGIGLTRAPEGAAALLVARLRTAAAAGVPVLALDVPSGIDADTGAAPGDAAVADLTLAFILAKRGLVTAAALDHVGELVVDSLGLDLADLALGGTAAAAPSALAIAPSALTALLPKRRADSHKGDHGRALCVGGDEGMGGALLLCAEAAARAGSGWVEVATRADARAALQVRRPEVLGAAVAGATALASLLARADVVAVGPGLGQGAWGRELLDAALRSGKPLVLDADALNLLAVAPRALAGAVLTPHPGEAARLLGCSVSAVQADRFAALDALVERYRCAVVLKGAGTLVGAPGEVTRVIRAGGPAMASAGMGDVLTGVIAALRAQGLSAFDAAWGGALAHADAADRASAGRARGLLAADLFQPLVDALNR